MKKLKAAVIGVGYLGSFHAQKYKSNPHIESIGVFDLNKSQAEKVAKDFEIFTFNSLDDLRGKVDLATIATTTKSHFEVAEKLLLQDIHLNIEKPITSEIDQAKKLIKIAAEKNLILSVGHIERFNPAVLRWRQRMGTPVYIEFERMAPYKLRGSDVSVIHDLMIHDLDLLLSLNPGQLLSIEAQGAKVKSKSLDWASVWLTFNSNLKVNLRASRVSPMVSRLIRSYEADSHWTINLNTGELNKICFGEGLAMSTQQFSTEKVDALQKETDAFIDAVLHRKDPFITGEEGLRALALAEKITSEIIRI